MSIQPITNFHSLAPDAADSENDREAEVAPSTRERLLGEAEALFAERLIEPLQDGEMIGVITSRSAR